RHGRRRRDRRRGLRLPLLFGLHGARLLVGAQRRGSGSIVATAGIQGRQARNRPLLLRPHPAAHAHAQGGDRKRRRAADDDPRRGPGRRLTANGPAAIGSCPWERPWPRSAAAGIAAMAAPTGGRSPARHKTETNGYMLMPRWRPTERTLA